MYTWKTKFEPGNRVKRVTGEIGIIDEVRILYPSGNDMDYWEKTLPKLANGKYQFTSYAVKFDNDEVHDIGESYLTEPSIVNFSPHATQR